MNKQVKKDWVKALRSGKYKQGFKALKIEDRFCCLGVLCDLHLQKHGAKWEKKESTNYEEYLGGDVSLPKEVVEWAKLSKDEFAIDIDALIGKNDKGESFEEIANLIENNQQL